MERRMDTISTLSKEVAAHALSIFWQRVHVIFFRLLKDISTSGTMEIVGYPICEHVGEGE